MENETMKVTVWRDHIVVNTIKGAVELPIKQIGKWHARLLPYHYIAAGKNGEADVIYNWRFDEPHSSEDIIDYEAEGRKIADFGKVKVWIVD